MLTTRLLRGARNQVRHVRPVKTSAASGLVADVYRQVERDFGMLAPPIALHAPVPEVMAASWTLLRESLLADGLASRAAKEVVATAVSEANHCPYCVAVHGASRRRAGEVGDAADALRTWAMRGGDEPFSAEHRAEYLGVAATFDYLNRMVNVFLPDSPLPGLPESAAATAGGLLGRVVVRDIAIVPGESVDLLPDAVLPQELAWATPNPTIAAALARASNAFDAAGARSVPDTVRELVLERVAAPEAGPSGPSRAWVEDDVARLPAQHRTAGRVALLTALASYQIDDALISAFLAEDNDDAAVIALTAWASWAAARRRVA
ncbi:carboxymuconolactone decarboxylase family protein [Haloechinothrix halophila]|uniref:carboxymuconolactone decarboxylase family protein n=1 Tax=Haloechinothrix halophila TaxID=1069073 RepID=UPI0003F70E8D|nr:carboxymuconolactone decarboxylase family protein [Haloechinothrix halophila]